MQYLRVALACWVMAAAMVVTGCGPSSAQIKTAKAAQYKAPPATILDLAVQVAQRTYRIGEVDPQGVRFATAPQFYTKEGGRISATNEFTGDFVRAKEGDVQLMLVVEVLPTQAERVMVNITPKTMQVVSGSPQPRPLLPTDPDLPPWIHGRVNALAVAIYDAAKQYIQP
ncbi:MAG: hypothetical protein SFX73_28555 [Kofleriaceae bacterium]|nr:hypothetical protein [Kofleriaceae bacterium]